MKTLNEVVARYGEQAKHIEVFTADNGRHFFKWHTDQITEHDRDEFCGLEEVIDWQLMTLEEYNNTILVNCLNTTDDYGWTDEDAPILCICVDENKIISKGATISINNGLSECTAAEALAEYPLSHIAEYMNDYWREWVNNNCEYSNDLEYLEQYLKHSPYDIIIG